MCRSVSVKEQCEHIMDILQKCNTIEQFEEEVKIKDWPDIDKNASVDDIREVHRTIWECAIKFDRKPETRYVCDCVLCHTLYSSDCEDCLGIWPIPTKEMSYRHTNLPCIMSYFGEWEQTHIKEFAEKIRDISFKGLDD